MNISNLGGTATDAKHLVDLFLVDGCGRCKYYKTAQCKVHNWPQELRALRQIVLDCGLTEELKWSMPVYTHQNKNIVMIYAFKEYCAISFFKGALLQDAENILVKPGENSQASRFMKFTQVADIKAIEPTLKAYIYEAIEVENLGLKVEFKKETEPMPQELLDVFEKDILYEEAFLSLTKGKQRGYIIHFSQPKQAATRISRIENCRDKIMRGEGMQDAYKNNLKKI